MAISQVKDSNVNNKVTDKVTTGSTTLSASQIQEGQTKEISSNNGAALGALAGALAGALESEVLSSLAEQNNSEDDYGMQGFQIGGSVIALTAVAMSDMQKEFLKLALDSLENSKLSCMAAFSSAMFSYKKSIHSANEQYKSSIYQANQNFAQAGGAGIQLVGTGVSGWSDSSAARSAQEKLNTQQKFHEELQSPSTDKRIDKLSNGTKENAEDKIKTDKINALAKHIAEHGEMPTDQRYSPDEKEIALNNVKTENEGQDKASALKASESKMKSLQEELNTYSNRMNSNMQWYQATGQLVGQGLSGAFGMVSAGYQKASQKLSAIANLYSMTGSQTFSLQSSWRSLSDNMFSNALNTSASTLDSIRKANSVN